MRSISEKAGVTVGAIYNHFPTKEDIWREVLITEHPYHEIFPYFHTSDGASIAAFVRAVARGMVNELRKRPDLLNLMFIEIVELGGRHIPELAQTILPEIKECREYLPTTPADCAIYRSPSWQGLLAGYFSPITLPKFSLSSTADLCWMTSRWTSLWTFIFTGFWMKKLGIQGVPMILRIKSLIRKEFIQIIRDPRTFGLTLLYPVAMLLVLGYAITNDVRNIPLAVLDRDQSSQSRALLAAYKAADYFTLDYFITSEDEMLYLIESNKARAAIIIPPDYGKQLISGRSAQVAFIIDGSDPNIANTALSAAVLIGQAQSTEIAASPDGPFWSRVNSRLRSARRYGTTRPWSQPIT